MFRISRFESLWLLNLVGLNPFDALDRNILTRKPAAPGSSWIKRSRCGGLFLNNWGGLLDRLHITLTGPMVVQDVFEVLLAGVIVLSDRRAFGG
jgi:hypothetical protein